MSSKASKVTSLKATPVAGLKTAGPKTAPAQAKKEEVDLSQVNEIALDETQAQKMRTAEESVNKAKLTYASLALQAHLALQEMGKAQDALIGAVNEIGAEHGIGDPSKGRWTLALDRMVFLRQS